MHGEHFYVCHSTLIPSLHACLMYCVSFSFVMHHKTFWSLLQSICTVCTWHTIVAIHQVSQLQTIALAFLHAESWERTGGCKGPLAEEFEIGLPSWWVGDARRGTNACGSTGDSLTAFLRSLARRLPPGGVLRSILLRLRGCGCPHSGRSGFWGLAGTEAEGDGATAAGRPQNSAGEE